MADIALRSYLEEIDGLIDGSRIEEAITHLKHILGIYPKALDAYRLLARALLEKNRHLDAADVFQRVLSSVPDDFISHIGMAVVREDEGNLDAAIWHMERAYEVQPSSQPIQEELRRLYGKRDGTEPPRLRLSRAALARMYDKGDLYPQAIGELRAALSDEPDRLDLRVLLASTLWRSRQRAEAAEASAKLLEVLPYCKEANRILAHIWHESGRPQDAQSYRRRLEALDPYEAFADPGQNGHGAAQTSPEKVLLPHLENVYGSSASDASRPDWMEALGIQYEEPTPAAAAATDSGDWLNALGGATDAKVAAGSGGIPQTDWLSTLRGEDQPANAADLFRPAASTPAPASANDSSDWLAGMGVADSGAAADGGDSPDWLTGMFPGQETASPTQAEPAPTGQADSPGADLPDWMTAEDVSASRPAARATPPPVEESAGTGMTGWLSALGGEMIAPDSAPVAASDSEVPDWLNQTAEAETQRPSKTLGDLPNQMPDWMQPTPASAPPAASSVEVPEWLQGEATQSSLTADSEVPDWLTGAGSDEPAAKAAPQSDLPDWLATANTTPARPSAQTDLPDWLSASGMAAPSTPAQAEVPDWLSASGASADDTLVSKKAPAQPPVGELPTWISEGDATAATAEPATPAWSATSAKSEPASDLPAWLAGTDAPTSEAAAFGADVPDWLTAAPTETRISKAPITGQSTDSAVPDWMQASAAEPESAPEDVPLWLTAPAETEAADWLTPSATPLPISDEMLSTDKEVEMSRADEEMPEWMKAAGWVPRDPAIPLDSASNLTEEEPELISETEPAPGVVPDWLKAMKPPEEARPAANVAGAPDWLRAAMEGDDTGPSKKPQTEPFEEIPDWLAVPTGKTTDTLKTFLDKQPTQPATPAAATMPDWLGDEEPPVARQPESASVEPGSLPDWLQSQKLETLTPNQPAPADMINMPGRETAEAVAAFLREQAAPPTFEPPAAATPAPSEMSEDEALAWLEGLAAKQGASEEELVTKRSADLPDWLRKPAESEPEPETVASIEPIATPVEGLPDWLRAPQSEETSEPVQSDWLPALMEGTPSAVTPTTELAAKQGANPEELVTKPPVEIVEPEPTPDEGLPDWLQAPAEFEPAAPVMPVEDSQATVPMDVTPTPLAEPAAMSDDEALAWLEGLAAKQGANAEELVTKPAERGEQAPTWTQMESVTNELARPSEAVTKELSASVEPPLFAEAPRFAEPITPKEPVAPTLPVAALSTQREQFPEPSSVAETTAADMSADEALAWLEALAAKQGANVEELVTKPEARADEMPAWVQSQAQIAAVTRPLPVEEPAPAEPVVEEKPDWLKQMEAEADQYEAMAKAPEVEPEPAAQPEMSEDEALAWLEALAAKQGANVDELVTKPEARVDEMPAWIQSQAEAAAELAVVAKPAAIETTDAEKPDWLKQMEAESDQYEAMAAAPTTPIEANFEEVQPESLIVDDDAELPELPAWLAQAPVEPEPKIKAAWSPSAAAVEEEPEPEPKIQAAWKPSTRPLPPLPPNLPEPTPVPEELPAWLAQPAEPEAPSWVPMTEAAATPQQVPEAETIAPAKATPKRPKKSKSPRKPRSATSRRPSKLRRSEEPEIVLALARQRLSEANVANAIEVYSELIGSGHMTADVINDLEAAVLKNSEQPELLRTLGDAYMRDNQLQKALDAYKQALLKL